MPPTKSADPEELIDRAWDARTGAARAKLARQALAIDPEAIDAYNLLALSAQSPVEKIALLKEAVAIGRRRWAAEIKRPAQHPFWLDIDTRPFMRAVHHLALLLWDQGERKEAVGLAEFLLKLNRNDNQGLRHLALAWHGALGDDKAVERLLKRYSRDSSTDYLYAAALDAFRRGGDAAPLLDEALSRNPYVPAFLCHPDRMPPKAQSQYVAMGSADEAASYVRAGREAWSKVPGALGWLSDRLGDDFGESSAADRQYSVPAEAPDLFEAPLSGALEELDRLLDICPDQDGTMTMGQLDGYLAGIIISPHDPPPAQWLPPIWGGSEEAFPGDRVRSARLAELVQLRKEEIAGELLEGGLAYSPVYDVDEQDEYLWQAWLDGFSTAMGVGGKDWDALLDSGDEDLATSFLGLMRFVLLARGLLPDQLEEEAGMAPTLLPYYVETIYRRQHGLARIFMGREPVRAGPKVGRNDPCPCGSGRKYKKCCGAS